MATTTEGRALTEAHRRRQLQLRAQVLTELLALRPGLDPVRFRETWPLVAEAVTAIIRSRQPGSVRLASSYYTALRRVESVPGTFRLTARPDFPTEAVRVSLSVTGPATYARSLTAGRTPSEAVDTVFTRVAGAAARHVLNGGRQTLLEAIREDDKAIGFERVTDARPCAFCAMLAGRGAVYKSNRTGNFQAHDHCGCTAEPRFLGDDRISERNRQFRDAYQQATRGERDQRASFRRAWSN